LSGIRRSACHIFGPQRRTVAHQGAQHVVAAV
jgi:hypothetical protein